MSISPYSAEFTWLNSLRVYSLDLAKLEGTTPEVPHSLSPSTSQSQTGYSPKGHPTPSPSFLLPQNVHNVDVVSPAQNHKDLVYGSVSLTERHSLSQFAFSIWQMGRWGNKITTKSPKCCKIDWKERKFHLRSAIYYKLLCWVFFPVCISSSFAIKAYAFLRQLFGVLLKALLLLLLIIIIISWVAVKLFELSVKPPYWGKTKKKAFWRCSFFELISGVLIWWWTYSSELTEKWALILCKAFS